MGTHLGGGAGIPDPAVKVTNGGLIWNGSDWVNAKMDTPNITGLAITTGLLANLNVTLAKLAAGSVDNSKVAGGAGIVVSKLAPGSEGQTLKTISGVAQWTT